MKKNCHILTKEDMAKGGRNSKRKPLDAEWRDKLEELSKLQMIERLTPKGKKSTKKVKEALIDQIFEILVRESSKGNLKAIEMLVERAYGRTAQVIDAKVESTNIIYLSEEDKDI